MQLGSYKPAPPPDYVLIHDGARPWITGALIKQVMAALVRYKAVIPALTVVETPKELDGSMTGPEGPAFIKRHLRRVSIVTAQTPQAFAFSGILSAHEKAAAKEASEFREYTDDAEVWGEFIGPVAVIPGEAANRKITFPEDLEIRT
jgi:2-C-methyl-D-erythritol 4-phosphate cytidylyltransferase